jgi:hypothetical protein
MYNTRIVKFKLRRGTDSQRKSVTFRSGELVYTYDIKRCFIGDGVTLGGLPISNINTISTTFPSFTALGDYTFRSDLLRTYICRETGFEYIGPYPDTTTINFSGNYLQIVSGGITRNKLSNSIASLTGGLLFDNVDGMRVSYDNTFSLNNSGQLSARIGSASITIDETSKLSASSIILTNANLQTYQGILTADGTFLVMFINGVKQGIRLWSPPLIDVAPPGPPPPPVPPADTEFILAEDLSPIISNIGDNIVWTNAFRNYLLTEDGEYLMTEDTDDILWD